MTIDESIESLLQQKQIIIEGFYARLLRQHQEVRPFFEAVNLSHQSTLLTMALIVVESHYSHGYAATRHYLHVLGHRHKLMGVKPAQFEGFRDCLLETLAEFLGTDWSNSLADAWAAALNKSVETMLEGYERDYTY